MEKPPKIPLKILKGMRKARLKREQKEKEKVKPETTERYYTTTHRQ